LRWSRHPFLVGVGFGTFLMKNIFVSMQSDIFLADPVFHRILHHIFLEIHPWNAESNAEACWWWSGELSLSRPDYV
jgi:hypothetical protein